MRIHHVPCLYYMLEDVSVCHDFRCYGNQRTTPLLILLNNALLFNVTRLAQSIRFSSIYYYFILWYLLFVINFIIYYRMPRKMKCINYLLKFKLILSNYLLNSGRDST